MIRPKESRKRLLTMIREAERPVSIQEVTDFENEQHLWFGPRTDAIDFILAKQVLGTLHINPETNLVEYIKV